MTETARLGGQTALYVTVLPYLPLSAPVEFVGWWLGPLDQFNGRWLSPDFERASRRLASLFRDPGGKPIKRPALLVRTADGADGRPPTPDEYEALQLAIAFAVIHQNTFWTPDTQSEAWRVATADNATVWVQPIDIPEGWISLDRGSRVRAMAGGHRLFDDGFTIPSRLELHLPFDASLDAELVRALYTVLLAPPMGQEQLVASLKVAVRWLIKSWQNTPSITWEDRLVFLKVATEALTGEEKSNRSASALAAIFATAHQQPGEGIGTDDLLWQCGEPILTRHWTDHGKAKTASVTQFEHWACALGDERNAIVHGEATHRQMYSAPDSRYNGPLIEIGDRVVREAIVVQLGNCGFPDVWRTPLARAGLAALRHLRMLAEGGK